MKKVIVNHSGSCEGYHYIAGQPVIVSDSVVRALGNNVKVLADLNPQPKEEVKPEVKEEIKEESKQEKKEIKFPIKDKMVKNAGKSK